MVQATFAMEAAIVQNFVNLVRHTLDSFCCDDADCNVAGVVVDFNVYHSRIERVEGDIVDNILRAERKRSREV